MADDDEQKQADDEEQKRLERVKVSIDVLKHITTLSGAAAVLLLGLSEQMKSGAHNSFFAAAAAYFALSTMVALVVIFWLLGHLGGIAWGTRLTLFLFGGGMLGLIIYAFQVPFWILKWIISYALPYATGAIALVAFVALILRFLILRSRRRQHDGGDDRAKEEPE